jgi:ribosome maturation factor RimP
MMSGGSRSAAGPVDDKHLVGLLRPVVAAVDMDLESLRVSVAGRRRLLRVIVDSDAGVSLDEAALDATDVMGNMPYTLEVSSPGIDRPLTEPRHWRRAAGRLVKVKTADDGTLTGRVAAVGDDGVTLEISGARRHFGYGELGPGAVQVEFGKLPDHELEDFDDSPDDGVPGERLPDEADLGAGGDGH